MAIEIRHKFVSPKQDGDDNTLVQPSNWNDDHKLTLNQDKIIGRASSGYGDAEEITCTAAGRALLDDNTAAEQRATLGLSSSDTPQFNGIALGHESDTTLTRLSSGVVGVEGVALMRASENLGDVANPVTARENLKFKTLTQAQFDALNPPDADTIYFITA